MQAQKKGPKGESGDDDARSLETSEDMSQAVEDAMNAVEARERGYPIESDGADDRKHEKKTPETAVQEALIQARHELEEALKQTQEEAQHLKDKWLRSAADFENYKKRMRKEHDDLVQFANERLLKDFLPTLDDLDRTLEATSSKDASANALLEGVRLVHRKLIAQLEKHGVTTFAAKGQAFDPNRHEAVQQIHSELPAGAVASELQRGFLLHDRLLRPAMVTVSLGPDPKGGKGAAKEVPRNE